ncbi:lytic polysaccharide monooxygenase [Trematosphaeria pertusa]|uniref:Lytic polysaccharide monooxygenase n=1 Tax=Trematosphaeria pertusa TaxID=390896 RepID=A0A6A6IA47_9PLEO|nr:lytic polysaccharide monooxygenase [Trematosphaeria pertusa]KAF2247119.1 lytic polysaccharide monooxygenase [Trematosphaeria pertusa]
MHLFYPPTLKGDNNPHTQGEADPYLNYPYGCCGQEVPGPCKGHLDLLDTDEGTPVVTWAPGQKVNFTLSGQQIQTSQENPVGGTHYGGSCQVGFSTDGGKTFKVATTWQGDCPLRDGTTDPSTQTFDFTVPGDVPSTERALFAWTWVNREKEFNMNCAVRHMQNAEKLNAPLRRAEAVAFSSRPDMLLDIDFAGAPCHSQGNPVELQFPDPGPDVVEGDGEYPLEAPSC